MSDDLFNFLFNKIQCEMQAITEMELTISKSVHRDNWLRYFECEIKGRRVIKILLKFIKTMELVFCLEDMLASNEIKFKYPEIFKRLLKLKINQESKVNWIEIAYYLSTSALHKELPSFKERMTETRKDVIESFLELKRILEYKLKMIAPKDLIKEKIFHQMFRNNERNKEKIVQLERLIENEEKKLKSNLEEKFQKIEENQKSIDVLNKMSEMEIKERVRKSQEAMIMIYTKSQESKKQLSESVVATITKYESTLKSNLQHQNEIRDEKFQVQNTLRSCVNKYDKEIGERFTELNQLKHQLELKTAEFNTWNTEYLRQQEQYYELMKEKEAEEKRKQEEKMLLFMMNRSAITIQRAWRKILAKKKKSKKKGKKGKK